MKNVRLPDLSRAKPYAHQKPHRPSHLARRLRPPPERRPPPDLSLFLYAGMVLAVIVLLVAIPYAIAYLVNVLSS
jgi:hypothetical protein